MSLLNGQRNEVTVTLTLLRQWSLVYIEIKCRSKNFPFLRHQKPEKVLRKCEGLSEYAQEGS
jgi:hypothetical protein